MCRKAMELGLIEVGFSEHVDFDPVDQGFGFFDYDRYVEDIERARELFRNTLIVRKGVEIDYQRCYEERIREWLQDKKFDFTIGSVHYLNHKMIGPELAATGDLRGIYRSYFTEVRYSVESGLFDVVGHLDLVGRRVAGSSHGAEEISYRENMKQILQEIAEQKMYLEINSKGMKEAYADTMPSREMISEYIESGGELVSVGSDAHCTEELGSGINDILDFLANRKRCIKLLFEQD